MKKPLEVKKCGAKPFVKAFKRGGSHFKVAWNKGSIVLNQNRRQSYTIQESTNACLR